MKLLLIGGTRFLGRHTVQAALAGGHEVTLFNRGQSNPDLFPDLEHIQGDRRTDLDRLANRHWDAVIDTCGYFPADVHASALALKSAVRQYIFVSTISVYGDLFQPGISESAPVATIEDPTVSEITDETYGPLKALCEQAVRDSFPETHLILRPGLIVGRYDPTDRFTYWPWRVASGGEVLAPEGPDWPVQIIDARDLAEWTIRLAETQVSGTYNAVGPRSPHRFGEILEVSRRLSGADASWTWVTQDFLVEEEVQPWFGLPLWQGVNTGRGMMQVDNRAAVQNGLTFRPLASTIEDTLDWVRDRQGETSLKAGLSRSREAMLLEAWHRKQNGRGQ